jgi:ribonuclease E
MSAFGIIEMTRQRQRASLMRGVYQDCLHCRGTGLVKTAESVALDVMRTIQLNVIREHMRLIEVSVSSDVAMLLLNRRRAALHEVETKHRRTIVIRPEAHFGLDQVEVRCYDHRGRLVPQA